MTRIQKLRASWGQSSAGGDGEAERLTGRRTERRDGESCVSASVPPPVCLSVSPSCIATNLATLNKLVEQRFHHSPQEIPHFTIIVGGKKFGIGNLPVDSLLGPQVRTGLAAAHRDGHIKNVLRNIVEAFAAMAGHVVAQLFHRLNRLRVDLAR